MLVDESDGVCRTCRSQLEIVGADDATMEVECTSCGDGYTVEPDAFNDGAIKLHFPQMRLNCRSPSWPLGCKEKGSPDRK
jgi:hypothetical protein